ncbi:MAG: PD-(D/E)XK nuclease family protein [Bacteroidales bacterium]|nr:PD-(D/E)XK nuclease family protein [Bacteroidales bacterium]
MDPFLKQVALHYRAQGDISSLCFIFPNRRAMAFFTKYLGETAVEGDAQPFVAPRMLTMNDFFYLVEGAVKTDRVHLLLDLYDCYSALRKHPESLDDFVFWGDILLGDFDDVDKYLVDPGQLFTNVAEFKRIQDSYSYLTPEQKEAIDRFLSHFNDGKELTVRLDGDDDSEGGYKEKFLHIWEILGQLYRDFGELCRSRSHSYEGQVYRSFAGRLLAGEHAADILAEKFPDSSTFVFTGLNALNECEKTVMKSMRNAQLAEFCWDYSDGIISDPDNKASFFMETNVQDFPQAFKPEVSDVAPEIDVISVPSSTGQAKLLPKILGSIPGAGMETAVVLPDEGLLIPVLNSIPAELEDINVTMGYPMKGSEFFSLMNDMAALQIHAREKDGKSLFYHQQVWGIFSNSLFKSVVSPEGAEIARKIKESVKYYIPEEDFKGDPLLETLFRRAADTPAIQEWQLEVISCIAPKLAVAEGMALEMDFAMEYWKAVKRLQNTGRDFLPATYFKLLGKLVNGSSTPFKGEPLRGLQIMGPLETRVLDFENIVILSCNEGIFPHRSVSSSFIPPKLRKGFGLPTYEFQDAVWAYYFYRLLQRCRRMWLVFDSRTEVSRSGEESRYIKQLELHFKLKLHRFTAAASVLGAEEPGDIAKTEADVETIKRRGLSPSALKDYLNCQARFYYDKVKGLSTEDEVNESLDSRMTGNVLHGTMEQLYKGHGTLDKAYLQSVLDDADLIPGLVRKGIMEELHSFEVTGRNIIWEDVVCRYVRKVIERDMELMDSYGVDHFTMLEMEADRRAEIGGFLFKGRLDRLDSFDPSEVRVVDYKTGKVTEYDFNITEDNAGNVVKAVFGPKSADRPGIALQMYLYDRFIQDDEALKGKRIVNSVYQTGRLFLEPVCNVALNEKFCSLMKEGLDKLLEEIADTSQPFRRNGDPESACKNCDFRTICGR